MALTGAPGFGPGEDLALPPPFPAHPSPGCGATRNAAGGGLGPGHPAPHLGSPAPTTYRPRDAVPPPPHASHPDTASPTLRGCSSEGPGSPNAPGRHASAAPGTRESRGGAGGRAGEGSAERRDGARGVRGGPARGPWPPGRAGRRGGRAALTRCCCRVLTAAAAADAALCRSSAACPGLSRLRVNLRVRSTAMAGAPIRCGRSARPAGLASADLLSPAPFRKRNSAPVPPSSSLNSLEAGFSLLQPHSPPPSLRRSFPTTFQTPRSSRRARPTGLAARPGGACAAGRGARGARGAAAAHAPRTLSWPAGAVPATSGTTDDGGRGGRAWSYRRGAPGPGPQLEASPSGAAATLADLPPALWGSRVGARGAQVALPPLGRGERRMQGLVAGIQAASPEPAAHNSHSGLWNKVSNSCKPSTGIH